jgi:hypothetical protein
VPPEAEPRDGRIVCPQCGRLLRPPDPPGPDPERLSLEELQARVDARVAEPDPRDRPCPGCGHARRVLGAEELLALGAAGTCDALRSGRARLGGAGWGGDPAVLAVVVDALVMRIRGTQAEWRSRGDGLR